METVVIIIGVLASLAMSVSLGMLLFRKYRKRGLQTLVASLIAIGVTGFAVDKFSERDAVQAGYLSADDKKKAEKLGYASAEEWDKDRKRVLAEQRADIQARIESQKEQAAKLEAQKQADENAKLTAAAAKENALKAKKAAHTNRLSERIIATIRQHYNIEPQSLMPNGSICREDGYCELHVGAFRIQVLGLGIAKIDTTTQASHSNYREMCAAVFSGISKSDLDFAAEAINGAFIRATVAGSFKHTINNVEIKISPDLNGIMGCQFFTHG